MTPWQNRTTALTQRMADDMRLRNYSQKTIDAYTYHVGRFAEFLGKSPESASPEDVRSFHKGPALDADGVAGRIGWPADCAESLPLVAARFGELGADSVIGGYDVRRLRPPGLPALAGRKCPG